MSVQTGETVAPPELVARGFLYDEDHEHDLLAEARDDLVERLRELTNEHATGSACCARTSTTRWPSSSTGAPSASR